MLRTIVGICVCLSLFACQGCSGIRLYESETMTESLTPGDVVNQSLDVEWRLLDPENTLYLTLDSGQVILELMPQLAPQHVSNTKALVRQGIFDKTNFYRVLDGFVAQGGPLFESEEDAPELIVGQYNIPAEFTHQGDILGVYTVFDSKDNFADETGYINGFAVGRDLNSNESWLLHCYGALGMGRSTDINSGGVALYIVNGQAQRYLDRNITVFGRVISGMEHIQALKRSANLNGPIDVAGKNLINNIQVAADMNPNEVLPIEVMDTQSVSFKKLLVARKNRVGDWFVYQHDYMDACGIPIPVRIQTEG